MTRLYITLLAMVLLSGCASVHPQPAHIVRHKAPAPIVKQETPPVPPPPPPAPEPAPAAPAPQHWHLKWFH